jgi:hypothetical protein
MGPTPNTMPTTTFFLWRHGLLAALLPWLAACTTVPTGSTAPPDAPQGQAWVQASAQGGWQVRAWTREADCPSLNWNGGTRPMAARVAPGVVPARHRDAQPEVQPSVFELRSCEAPWPPEAAQVRVGAQVLNRPAQDLRRIVLIGDTGCRMKASEQAYQNCLDPVAWPFASVARSAAALQPDLVVHVGDLHYRESPCPADRPGCAGSPWGYGVHPGGPALFAPPAPLLAAAPWVFVRGNHESCSRAGLGWFRFVDGHPWRAVGSCEDPAQDAQGDFTEPYAVPLSADTQLIVFDSSFAAGRPYAPGSPVFQRYAAQLASIAKLAATKPHNFFLNHHPVLGFAGGPGGEAKAGHAGLLSVMSAAHPQRLYAEGVDLVMNGHVHLFEALSFSSAHPATLVLGNSGSAMEGHVSPSAALAAEPAPGAKVADFATQPGFGFATLDQVGTGWRLTEWTVQGQALTVCQLNGQHLRCNTAP